MMKNARLLLLAASLMVGAVNIPGAVSAEDERRFGTNDRYYDRRDRNDNWWDRRDDRRAYHRRDLEGAWYRNGDRNQRTEIVALRRGRLEAIGEKGNKSRLEVDRNGNVVALDWGRGGLRGDVRRDRIEWEDGSKWTREPWRRAASRR